MESHDAQSAGEKKKKKKKQNLDWPSSQLINHPLLSSWHYRENKHFRNLPEI